MGAHTLPQKLSAANMFPASGSGINIDGYGYILAWGATAPSDGDTGYAPGCLFFQLDGTTVDTVWYVNIGDKSSSDFDLLDLTAA
jgi:hypothetical protein